LSFQGKTTDTVPFSTAEQFRKFCVYIPQHDFQFPTLTCREMMMYTAQFFPETSEKAKATAAVNELIKEMGLTSCADTKIGGLYMKSGLSGGQKKRLSIALGFLKSTARIVFLDEPTSGLDSAAAIRCMEYLKRLAVKQKRCIIATIHQPPSQVYDLMNRILLISNGRTAYYGSSKMAMGYFASLGHFVRDPNLRVLPPSASPSGEESAESKFADFFSQFVLANQ
jgi:ABC-type multidrug transport system ATPase subunit